MCINSSGAFAAEIRVYGVDLDRGDGTPAMLMARRLGPRDGNAPLAGASMLSYFVPSVAVEPGGGMLLTFNMNHSDTEAGVIHTPSIWTSRHLVGAGEIRWRIPTQRKPSELRYTHEPQLTLPLGSGANGTSTPYRWGEWAGTSVDPDGGIWAYHSYAAAEGEWGTWLTKVAFP